MAILFPKDYQEPQPVAPPQVTPEDLQARVKAFTTEPRYYSEIVAEVQRQLRAEDKHVRNRDVEQAIEAVREEWHPVAAEPIEEIGKV